MLVVMDAVNRVAENFDGLDPKAQKLLVCIGMFLAVLAPLTSYWWFLYWCGS